MMVDADRAATEEKPWLMLVEDVLVNRRVVSAQLQRAGYRVIEASDGHVAVRLLQQSREPIAAILMDLYMPTMDGFEATVQIRALSDERIAKLPIFAFSAELTENEWTRCSACGMNGAIAKPLSLQQLATVLAI